jgi:predicted nucleic acid-binding protein
MALFYLDASALVKRYKTEQGSEVIDYLFEEKSADDRLVASFLVVIEIVGVAVRLRRNQTVTEDQLSELLARFNEDQQ